ncbi:phosphotransferase [Mycoplasma sp. 5370]
MKLKEFPLEINKKLKKISFFYEGNHNKTYIGYFENKKVQIRVKKNNIVNSKNEENFFLQTQKNNFVYYKEGNYIKFWISGENLEKIFLTKKKQRKILEHLYYFSSLKVKDIEVFNWETWNHNDKKITKLLNGYKNEKMTLSHGDLRKKNIIINKKNNIYFIDFEWTRLNYLMFDLASLYLYVNISKKLIIKYFKIKKNNLDKWIYLVKKFNNEWNEKMY